jgi:hypothetical protein
METKDGQIQFNIFEGTDVKVMATAYLSDNELIRISLEDGVSRRCQKLYIQRAYESFKKQYPDVKQ